MPKIKRRTPRVEPNELRITQSKLHVGQAGDPRSVRIAGNLGVVALNDEDPPEPTFRVTANVDTLVPKQVHQY